MKNNKMNNKMNKYDLLEESMKKYNMREDRIKLIINSQLPTECVDCPFLQIINLEQQKVRCPYRIINKCLLNKKRE